MLSIEFRNNLASVLLGLDCLQEKMIIEIAKRKQRFKNRIMYPFLVSTGYSAHNGQGFMQVGK